MTYPTPKSWALASRLWQHPLTPDVAKRVQDFIDRHPDAERHRAILIEHENWWAWFSANEMAQPMVDKEDFHYHPGHA